MAPSTNVSDWFLSGSDRNNPDTKVQAWTTNNQVDVLIDGASYMPFLYGLLTTAGKGDFFYYCGLELNLDVWMRDPDNTTSVQAAFTSASNNGVDIRVMLSNHPKSGNRRAHRVFRKLNPPIQCILDSRFRGFGSAHQKFSVLSLGGTLHAFCGGIDLQVDRYDNGTHSLGQNRKYKDFPGGWHDVHTHIQGPACADLVVMFWERWNNPAPPEANENGIYEPIPETPISPSAIKPVGSHSVQLLRTFCCGYQELESTSPPSYDDLNNEILNETTVNYPFATQGEFSASEACIKAIGMAQDFIYIEDQYFFSYQIAAALRDRMIQLKAQQNKDLLVIVLVAAEPTADRAPILENYYHAQTVQGLTNDLKQKNLDGNFAIYDLSTASTPIHPQGVQIYVHAKLMIVDDLWVEIGSMNCNRRSMTYDLEAAVAVFDDNLETVSYGSYLKACTFARNLRLSLWLEHLGLVIDDPLTGFNTWIDVANKQSAHVRPHTPAKRQFPWKGVWDKIADPQGTCPGELAILDPWPPP